MVMVMQVVVVNVLITMIHQMKIYVEIKFSIPNTNRHLEIALEINTATMLRNSR